MRELTMTRRDEISYKLLYKLGDQICRGAGGRVIRLPLHLFSKIGDTQGVRDEIRRDSADA